MAKMQFKYTGGYDPAEFVTKISSAVDVTLTDIQKDLVVAVELTAASKAVVLGLTDGQPMLLYNVGGTNAFTAKNLSGDTGTSIAAGKIAFVLGSTTANGTKILVLN